MGIHIFFYIHYSINQLKTIYGNRVNIYYEYANDIISSFDKFCDRDTMRGGESLKRAFQVKKKTDGASWFPRRYNHRFRVPARIFTRW